MFEGNWGNGLKKPLKMAISIPTWARVVIAWTNNDCSRLQCPATAAPNPWVCLGQRKKSEMQYVWKKKCRYFCAKLTCVKMFPYVAANSLIQDFPLLPLFYNVHSIFPQWKFLEREASLLGRREEVFAFQQKNVQKPFKDETEPVLGKMCTSSVACVET